MTTNEKAEFMLSLLKKYVTATKDSVEYIKGEVKGACMALGYSMMEDEGCVMVRIKNGKKVIAYVNK